MALCGTGISPAILQLLGERDCLYAVLDADAAGQDAAGRLAEAFGSRLIYVPLPPGTKDPAELARLPRGSALFRDALRQAVDRHIRLPETGCWRRHSASMEWHDSTVLDRQPR